MPDVDALIQRYVRAVEAVVHDSSSDEIQRPIGDTSEFMALRDLLTPLAESGNSRCQYALACIYFVGYLCESAEEFRRDYEATMQIATRWLVAAAKQGHWFALDNLISVGVGPEAERVREAARQFEREHPELLACDPETKAPLHFWEYQQELCKAVYGCVIDI